MKPTEKQVKEAFKTIQRAGYISAGMWHKDDIKTFCNDNEIKLTARQIQKVKDTLEKAFDATNGINWDVISETINTLYPQN